MRVELHAKSDVGRVRRGNEDNFLLLDLAGARTWSGSDGSENPDDMRQFTIGEQGLVLVVSDGMGGALAGDVASRMAIEAVRDVLMGENADGAGCEPGAELVDCLRAPRCRRTAIFTLRAWKTAGAAAWVRPLAAPRFWTTNS